MREQPKPDPDKCPICNYRWSMHTTKGARECRADLARQRGEEPIVAVPRPPTVEERAAAADRDLARATIDGELLVPARGLNGAPARVQVEAPAPEPPPDAKPSHTFEVFTGRRARSDVDPKAARAWAIANGRAVPTRGMLPRSIIDAYRAAQCEIAADFIGAEVTPAPMPLAPDPPPAVDIDRPDFTRVIQANEALADAYRNLATALEATAAAHRQLVELATIDEDVTS